MLLILGLVWFQNVYRWLAPQCPIEARYLVVEGWVPDYALEFVVREFRRGKYERIFTTGGPIERGKFLSEFQSHAQVAAASLLRMGLTTNEVTAVPSVEWRRNRTFASAESLREYCSSHSVSLESVNLVSVGAHTRRSGLCFRKALGPEVGLGLLAIDTRDYDVDRWWKYSQGVKDIVGETVSITYTWLSIDLGQ